MFWVIVTNHDFQIPTCNRFHPSTRMGFAHTAVGLGEVRGFGG